MAVVPLVVILQQIYLLVILLPLLHGCNLALYGYLVLSNWNCLIVQGGRWLQCNRCCTLDLPSMVNTWSSITKEMFLFFNQQPFIFFCFLVTKLVFTYLVGERKGLAALLLLRDVGHAAPGPTARSAWPERGCGFGLGPERIFFCILIIHLVDFVQNL